MDHAARMSTVMHIFYLGIREATMTILNVLDGWKDIGMQPLFHAFMAGTPALNRILEYE